MRLLTACLLLVALTACNRTQKKTIGMVPKGNTNEFWQSVHAGANKAAREAGVELAWQSSNTETDFNGQLQIVESMITRRVDAIVLAPIERRSLVNVVERGAAAGIPFVIFDSGIDTDRFIAHVETDNYHAGEIAAERVGRLLGGKGEVAMVKAQPGAGSTTLREDGFRAKLQHDFPNIRIVAELFGLADYAKSLQVTENILTAHPALDAVFACNESATVGALQALKARKGTRVRLVGFDWTAKLLDDLKSGLVDAVVVQDPFRMGYDSLRAAIAHLDGKPVARIQKLPPLLVDRNNIGTAEVQSQIYPDLKKYL